MDSCVKCFVIIIYRISINFVSRLRDLRVLSAGSAECLVLTIAVLAFTLSTDYVTNVYGLCLVS